MKKPALYIETSVFGFFFDRSEKNASKKESSIMLFEQIYKGYFDAYYSNITIAELEKTENSKKRKSLLSLIPRFGLRKLPEPDNLDEIELMASILINGKIIPEGKKDDAFHIAISIFSPQIDYLVTCNYKHLANKNVIRQVKSAALSQGYEVKFEVATPEEVILYE